MSIRDRRDPAAEAAGCRAEIERLHVLIEGLLTGASRDTAGFALAHAPDFTLTEPGGRTLTRPEVLAMIDGAQGAVPGLRITIEGVRVVASADEFVVATYREVQVRAAGGATVRAATVVFERDASAAHGLRWRHLHETWAAGSDRVVYKLVGTDEWASALRDGRFAGAGIDLVDGYVHLSTAAQAAETARRHFAGRDALTLVALEVSALGAALRWEPSRGGDLFPHVYGDLDPTTTVRWSTELPLPATPDGDTVAAAVEAALRTHDN
ncbi:DUF952 domain-containing protein [Embleya sp. AB8]|uniref:DUF952 domain-containing protein n=1 Tax=Embleya sp. AB8 TaxID=3156304 RepID=UPI003C796F6C